MLRKLSPSSFFMPSKIPDFQLLFESLPGMYYALYPDFRIAAVSDVFLQSTMTTREVLIGKYLFDVFPENPEERDARGESSMRASLQYVIDHKVAHTMAVLKYDIPTPDGKYEERYWSPLNHPVLNATGDVEYIIHQVKDVSELMQMRAKSDQQGAYHLRDVATDNEAELYQRAQEIQNINDNLLQEIEERKQAEARAATTQQLLQATIESHKDLLIFSIDTNYRYLTFNSAFQLSTLQAYGTTVSTGSSLLDSITIDDDRKKAKQNCDRALAGENHVTVEQYGDIVIYFFETRYTPIVDDKGVVMGVTVQSANITDRKRAEEQIRSLNQELESFTYSVAHDLRAPLRSIDGYTGILKEEYRKLFDDEANRLLESIMNNAKMMGKLIDDLLDFSRIGKLSVRHQLVDMNSLFKKILHNEFNAEQNKVRFIMAPLESAKCDSSLIRNAISNLLSNAIKYSRTQASPEVSVSCLKNEMEIVYAIKDNGVGFDMKYAGKLFGVFQRLHKLTEFEGTGVGLAIVHRVVTKHGGKVWAESELGKGSTFYFSLPIEPCLEV